MRDKELTYIYLIKIRGQDLYKIGKSKNPQRRMKQLSTASAFQLDLIYSVYTYGYIEKRLHKMFFFDRKNREWFSLSEEKVNFIIEWLTSL